MLETRNLVIEASSPMDPEITWINELVTHLSCYDIIHTYQHCIDC